MDKYLITGGAGFIGSNLAARVVAASSYVQIVDDLSMGKRENIAYLDKERLTFHKESITNYEFMRELFIHEKFDYIVLLGAVASVADSVENPYKTHQVNQEANINLFETIRKNNLKPKKILFASSAAVYGNNPELPKKESSPIEPLTPYAIDKFASESYALTYGRLYGLPTVATRFFNVYGPKQNPASPYAGVLSIILNCLKENNQFKLYGDGSQTRDFTYVEDVVDAILLLLHNDSLVNDVYNVATGNSVSLNEVIGIFEKGLHQQLKVEKFPERQGDIKFSEADISKITAASFKVKYAISAGLEKYISGE
ncbi:NAD-dependent epimerase/dehydratase family protein [Liquorilactobacillus satsumensis]|uniref:NAD-dependent epimerase/dehydratase family protein n=1 Tax=Liquorilactobacillus satsumensis TaxID=259059 RepID=UPI001E3CF286|nr:NAD-dependent epimerase/dehydratase family protein [Liquorilactobacillus satsumensis]MCC7667107.1 epimerase [Liquorilactobacillus satsumensis]MCP9358234.1 GDP-mannose 4,6-dehydratase [Liquorilactobacillus satsumensis]MCP9372188.1 GDP-mannose 4,6-dehydratase [Liquorilactobacillus satsumensis]